MIHKITTFDANSFRKTNTPLRYHFCMKLPSKYSALNALYPKDNYDQTSSSIVFCFIFQCSYYPGCERNEDVNAQRVKEHQDKYGSGNYSCLYDVTVGSNKVIRVRKLGQDGMVHCLLWPSLVIVVSVVFIIMMIHACGCKYVCACPLPQDVKEAAAARRGMSGNGVQMHSIRTVYFQEPSLSY